MKVSLPALTELPVLAPRKRRQDRRTPKSALLGANFVEGAG
jgi:hypothetical protein